MSVTAYIVGFLFRDNEIMMRVINAAKRIATAGSVGDETWYRKINQQICPRYLALGYDRSAETQTAPSQFIDSGNIL